MVCFDADRQRVVRVGLRRAAPPPRRGGAADAPSPRAPLRSGSPAARAGAPPSAAPPDGELVVGVSVAHHALCPLPSGARSDSHDVIASISRSATLSGQIEVERRDRNAPAVTASWSLRSSTVHCAEAADPVVLASGGIDALDDPFVVDALAEPRAAHPRQRRRWHVDVQQRVRGHAPAQDRRASDGGECGCRFIGLAQTVVRPGPDLSFAARRPGARHRDGRKPEKRPLEGGRDGPRVCDVVAEVVSVD